VGASHRSRGKSLEDKEIRQKKVHFFASLLLVALSFHGLFMSMGAGSFSWRLIANGLVLLFLTLFSWRYLLAIFRSFLSWVGLWLIFLGEAFFLFEYPAVFFLQESLHRALLLGGTLLITLGLWEERQRYFRPEVEKFLEGTMKPAIFLDGEGRIQGANSEAVALLGCSLAELRRSHFTDFLPAALREKAWDRFQTIRTQKIDGRGFSLLVNTREGKELLVKAAPLFSLFSAEKKGMVFTLEDLTRSRAGLLSLYREGRKLRGYLEAVQDIFLILDREGRVRYLNRAGSDLLGVKRRELLGETLDGFLKGEEKERGEKIFRMLLAGELPPEGERVLEIVTARGEKRKIRWNCQILYAGEAIGGFALSGIDVTEETNHWEELQSEHLFHWTLLHLIHQALQEEPFLLEAFLRKVIVSLGAVFATEETWYLRRAEDGRFVVEVGRGGEGIARYFLRDGNLLKREAFITHLRWEENTIVFLAEGEFPFLVLPLFVLERLEGLFLFGGSKKAFTGVDLQRAQIVRETLELLFFRRKTEEELLHLSSHDSLTGALNHKAFREKGAEILALAERYGRPLSVIFVDVDNFKSVNDRFGHLFGDRVLYLLAQHLRANLRRNDLLARFGGDEFVLLLPETPGEKARELLERLEQNPLFLEEGEEVITCRFSAGVSVYPEDGRTLEALMEVADLRMYEGKKTRKKRV
jgi:diguanylate cyclase (GGDEF)-like protein/PAS domain S-box-containing protein